MKKKLVIFILLLGCLNLAATKMSKKNLSIEEAILAYSKGLYPKRLANTLFRPKVNSLTYVKKKNLFEYFKGKEKKLLDIKGLKEILGDEVKKITYFPYIRWIDKDIIMMILSRNYFFINLNKKKVIRKIKIPAKAQNLSLSPDNKLLAFTRDKSLFYLDKKGNEVLIAKGDDNFTYGHIVSRNEMGINKGIFWSPDSKKIAFYAKDEREVSDYPILDVDPVVAKANMIKYPMAGMSSEKVKLGLYNLKDKKVDFFKTGDFGKYQYLTSITWNPDSKNIMIGEINRPQKYLKMNKYSASTLKKVKTVFEEKSDKWVSPCAPLLFLDNNRFLWISQRGEYKSIYLYNLKKENSPVKLNKNQGDVIGILKVSGNRLFFSAADKKGLNAYIFSTDLKSKRLKQITKKEGLHRGIISDNGEMIMDYYSSLNNPGVYSLMDKNGKTKKVLLKSKNPLEKYNIPSIKFVEMNSKDNKYKLYGRIILPVDFDANKKYPVIIYVYGGPHLKLVRNSWLGACPLWQIYMAQRGYIMFTMDNRGTPYRGKDFEQDIHRRVGVLEVEDQMQGVEYLKSLKYVDQSRIGVHGWSYGGFMTISLKLKYPEIFKVAVAGGPVIDWKKYEVMYTERYMDTPQDNKEGYENANLLKKVSSLKGRLLVIHGVLDPTVVLQQSLCFLQACIKEKKLVDYFVYPKHPHNVRGFDRVHLMRMVNRYFDTHL